MSKLLASDVVFAVSMLVFAVVAMFTLTFDRSKGWRAGWVEFKRGFISYGLPMLSPFVAAAVVYMLGLAVVKYFY